MKFKVLKQWISTIFYVLLVIFLAINIRKFDFAALKDIEISIPFLSLSLALTLAFRYLGAWIWLGILRDLGEENARYGRDLVFVYAKAWLGRYIPGTLPWILGKVHFASERGLSKTKLAIGSFLEGVLQTMVLLVFSMLLLLFDGKLSILQGNARLIIGIFLVLGTLLLWPSLFNRLFSFIYRKYKKETLEDSRLVRPKLIVRAASLYAVGALLGGLSFFFLVKSIHPAIGFGSLAFLVGLYNLSGVLGILSIFPGGLGVREGVQFLFLISILPHETTLLIVVIARLWSIVADLLFFGLSRLALKSKAA